MANVLVQESSLQSIAAAIRSKNGTQNTYTPAQMGPAISALNGAEKLEPHFFDLDTGYVYTNSWRVGGDTVNYSDVYELQADTTYLIALGQTVGSRFRALFSTDDTSVATVSVAGTNVIYTSNPASYAAVIFKPSSNGYLTITKDNDGTAGLKTYVYDIRNLTDGSN